MKIPNTFSYLPAILLLALVCSACESGWTYEYYVVNHSDSPAVVRHSWNASGYYMPDGIPDNSRQKQRLDTIRAGEQRLILSASRLNGGPVRGWTIALALEVYRRDSLIFRQKEIDWNLWQYEHIKNSIIFFNYTERSTLHIFDNGVRR